MLTNGGNNKIYFKAKKFETQNLTGAGSLDGGNLSVPVSAHGDKLRPRKDEAA